MKKYKLTFKRTQRGVQLDWSREIVVECSRKPEVGEGRALTVHPPIYETITKVEEL